MNWKNYENLKEFITMILKGETQWWALSIKTDGGTTIALHSEKAPKRPRGLS